MRPNREMPLVNNPFSLYSNMTDDNVPREFYMIAREKTGLVVDMPPDAEYVKAKKWTSLSPAYPQDGYIFEKGGLVVVNLGEHKERWKRFDFAAYRSPNENLLFHTAGLNAWIRLKRRIAMPFVRLAEKYRWTLSE